MQPAFLLTASRSSSSSSSSSSRVTAITRVVAARVSRRWQTTTARRVAGGGQGRWAATTTTTTTTTITNHSRTLRMNSSSSSSTSGKPPMPRVLPPQAKPSQQQQAAASAAAAAAAKNHIPPVTPTAAGSGRLATGVGAGFAENRTPVTWTSLFLVAVVAASAVAYYRIERERRLEAAMGKVVSSESEGWTPKPDLLARRKFVKTTAGWLPIDDGWGAPGKPAIGGPWSLVDLDGNLVTNEQFKGKWLLLYFGFARCPDICPSEMNKVATVLDTLKQTHPKLYQQIVPIFVSVDPARDSLQALRAYAKDFHPDYIFLTGTPEQVARMAKKYRVYMSKADETEEGDYLVDHSIVIYLHDAEGDLADCLTQSMRPVDVVNKVVERMTFVPQY
eukprot:scaffold17644_cov170-Amphora_coffeaeformis.AAC.3